jgi:alkylation response protein AidB-like acyl-CoA dehydrogenase
VNVLAYALGAAECSPDGERVLSELLAGSTGAAWVMGAESWSPGPGIVAKPADGGYRLAGEVRMVPDAPLADWLLVTAHDGPELSQFLVRSDHDGVGVAPVRSLDITQRFATVTFENAEVRESALVGPRAAAAAVARQFEIAVILAVAETVGAADALFALTTEYAKQRTAFGRPIGSFQALKHQLADLGLALEAAKAIAVEATRSAQLPTQDSGTLASIAKAWAGDAAVDIAQGCLQVFGGIGYTWEHDLHLYLRRLTLNSLLYGQPRWHRRRIWSSQPGEKIAVGVGSDR